MFKIRTVGWGEEEGWGGGGLCDIFCKEKLINKNKNLKSSRGHEGQSDQDEGGEEKEACDSLM